MRAIATRVSGGGREGAATARLLLRFRPQARVSLQSAPSALSLSSIHRRPPLVLSSSLQPAFSVSASEPASRRSQASAWLSLSARALSFSSSASPAEVSHAEVLVVGAGLTGLTAAHTFFSQLSPPARRALQQRLSLQDEGSRQRHAAAPSSSSAPSCSLQQGSAVVIVAEAAARTGGCIRTRTSSCGRFLFDVGANSFRLTSGTFALLRDLDLLAHLQRADTRLERFVGFNGRLHSLPFSSLSALFSSDLLSRAGKLRLLAGMCGVFPPRFLWQMLHPRAPSRASSPPSFASPSSSAESGQSSAGVCAYLQRTQEDESVEEFVSRRLGPEMHARVLDALVTGICAGDASQLSMKAALPAAYKAFDRGLIFYALQLLASKLVSAVRASRAAAGRAAEAEADAKRRGEKTRDAGVEGAATKRNHHSMRDDPSMTGPDMQGIVNFDEGMEVLTKALEARLPLAASHASGELPACSLRTQWKLKELSTVEPPRAAGDLLSAAPPSGASFASSRPSSVWFEALFETPDGLRRVRTPQVLLTVSSAETARALRSFLSPGLLHRLETLPAVSMALVTLVYSKPELRRLCGAAGAPRDGLKGPRPAGEAAAEEPHVFEDSDTPAAATKASHGAAGGARREAERRARRKSSFSFSGASLADGSEGEKPTGMGFGFLLPNAERKRRHWKTLGGIFVSDVFDGRVSSSASLSMFGRELAPAESGEEDVSLVTMFIGGSHDQERVKESDEALGVAATEDLLRAFRSLCGASGGSFALAPEEREKLRTCVRVLNVERWRSTIPQYVKGHGKLVEELRHEVAGSVRRSTADALGKAAGDDERGGEEGGLIVEGTWVSGAAVGDRIDAGKKAGLRMARAAAKRATPPEE
ncbi:hypothetical protein BESB_032760 [Besnoitia besnoiti]|uniref:Uncharacterized protein n=1 Tax=Besnoitia besnoiti TaxID=94643 RepID=A0A2A9LZ99_BESBE|nr:uncharacterized protein BESB_032760 [Besnoitia besnoiti]PFH31079.1 hypothetical protein BESB_032760 [Besnoitia besnoiti]